MSDSFWADQPVVITGVASFIGSTLCDALVKAGAAVIGFDDLSSGKIENVNKDILFHRLNIRTDFSFFCEQVPKGALWFHLAADHGGRGYVELNQAACAGNFALDGMVIDAAYRSECLKFVYASSGCVYPNHIQTHAAGELYLTEDMAGPPFDCDGAYGYAKMMAEETLRAYHKDYGMLSASARFFTVYGPRGHENHAIIAMIARAFLRKDPFDIWGDGTQVRNWTYVDDIVSGLMALAESDLCDGSAVNLGTMERVTVMEAVEFITELACADDMLEDADNGYYPSPNYLLNMPTGPVNRVADNSLAKRLLQWKPQWAFKAGVRSTWDWYNETHTVEEVEETLDERLLNR